MNDLFIGLDIGTSSLKLIILSSDNKIVMELSESTQTARISNKNSSYDEQNVDKLITLVDSLFNRIPFDLLKRSKAIQICGQMHGIVLWNKNDCKNNHSNLVTWQDSRCDKEFIKKIPIKSVSDFHSGFGCATLFWYSLNNYPIESYNASGTIQDFFTFLIGQNDYLMSDQNANSWGYFCQDEMKWQNELKECCLFPYSILPKVSRSATKISNSVNIMNIKLQNTSIYSSLGDLQCSVYSCLENEDDCVINISTSSQVCISVERSKYELIKDKLPKSITTFPYFSDKVLLVAASLNGGNALEKFVQTILDWNFELNLITNKNEEYKSQIWSGLIKSSNELNQETTLICKPTIFSERHDKDTFASLSNIKLDNISSPGLIFTSICKGLIVNLQCMFPADLLRNEFKIKRIVGTGSVLSKIPIMKNEIERLFELPVVFNRTSDSALGAASFIKDYLNK